MLSLWAAVEGTVPLWNHVLLIVTLVWRPHCLGPSPGLSGVGSFPGPPETQLLFFQDDPGMEVTCWEAANYPQIRCGRREEGSPGSNNSPQAAGETGSREPRAAAWGLKYKGQAMKMS